jgi:cytochrome d ubiquinol oxidase subunit I
VDWCAVIINPSFPYRLVHMSIAAFLATALMVAGSAAWLLLNRKDNPEIRKMLSMAMWMLVIVAPVQAVVGDFHGLNTLHHQPAKIAAMEGHWQNEGNEGVPLILFGIPDMEAEKTKYKIEVPRIGSLILTHSLDGTYPGLKEFPKEDRPNSLILFWSFRVMVGLGLLMILLGLVSVWLRWRRRMETSRPFLRFALLMGPAGLIAMLAGWFTTEIGRQPWVVYKVMRTADAVSPHGPVELSITLAIFIVVYFAVFGTGIAYLLRLVRKGPIMSEGLQTDIGGPGQDRTPSRPLSAAKKSDRDDASSEKE